MSAADLCATVGCNHPRDEHNKTTGYCLHGVVVHRKLIFADGCTRFTEPPTVAERYVSTYPLGNKIADEAAEAAWNVVHRPPVAIPDDALRGDLSSFLFSIFDLGTSPNALREADAIIAFLDSRKAAS